ncbi:hypothetical protein OROMI_019796 [Orobanche minor]
MSDAKDVRFSLNIVTINNLQKTNVQVFAEADSDFADVLLSFLTLPLATIVRVLRTHYGDQAPPVGSLTSLYNGLANLDGGHFRTDSCKWMLLNPRSSSEPECHKLKLNVDDTLWKNYRELAIWLSNYNGCGVGGVFTKRTATYIISDDLRMVPVTGSLVQTLGKLGIKNACLVESKNMDFGFNEILPLIEDSMSPSYYMRGGVACIYPKVEGSYVKGPKMFMVADDLTVTPFSITSALSVLKVLKICLSDVEEVEVNIGLEEALRILKASLTSAFALTDALSIEPAVESE